MWPMYVLPWQAMPFKYVTGQTIHVDGGMIM